jgi:RES domain-containing protein
VRIKTVALPDGRVWLRVASASWNNPLDPSHAREAGGRWNPPHTYPALYLNADLATARGQLERMLQGYPVGLDDLDEDAFVLVAVRLPKRQRCADAVSTAGLKALELPASYPLDAKGKAVPHSRCQRVGSAVRARRLRGLWCRSAVTPDGRGRELAWFPASARSRARPVWERPLSLAAWLYARQWTDIGLATQANPLR